MALTGLAGNHPDYSIDNSTGAKLIPQLFSSKFQVKFYDDIVVPAISNTDYEGEIKGMGDRVTIRTIPDIVVRPYSRGQKLTTDTPESPAVELLIDQAESFSLGIDDIDRFQSDVDFMTKYANDAAKQMKFAVEDAVLQSIYADVDANNAGATAGFRTSSLNMGATGAFRSLDKTNVLDAIVDAETVLDEQSVDQEGRFMVIPPKMAGLISKSDLKDASLAGDDESIIRTDYLGMVGNFKLYKSNRLAITNDGGTSVHNIVFGHPSALTFAGQINKVEMLRNNDTFGDILRGLLVYGFSVVQPKGLGHLYAAV